MPAPRKLLKAEFREIEWKPGQSATEVPGHTVQVQFNPEAMTLNYSNQKAGGDQRGGSAIQWVGQGATKLAMELWFDATADGASGDVRELTGKVNYFMQPQRSAEDQDPKWIAPGIRVVWGTFLFDGIMDSLNEKLEYFSEDGKPLRSQLSLSISNQIIQFAFGQQSSGSLIGQSSPVLLPRQGAVRPDSIQQMAVAMPGGPAWQSLAAANGIENPRSVAPGSLIDPNIASQPGRASANFGIDIASLTGR